MIYKRFLKKFNSQSDYESQKDSVMGIPHVVLFEDTKELLYASESEIPSVDYSKEYFTIVNTSDSPLDIQLKQKTTVQTLNYKLSTSSDWSSSTSVTVNGGEEIQFKGNYTPVSDYGIGTFKISGGPFDVKGNIMSLLFDDNFVEQTNLEGYTYAFYVLFRNCTTLTNANELILPATTLANWCYSNMFEGCSNLTTAPELPATTLAYGCYSSMFNGCSSLTTAPELPATTLASSCYTRMFNGCTSLTTAPELPATTLASSCYGYMFYGCSSLASAPSLPATTLASYCYSNMFKGCSNLTIAPELPATTLASDCYLGMFNGCTSLTIAPELLATELSQSCYCEMFYGCTNLTTAPELPATKLASRCYEYMFYECTSLTTAPELPATKLASSCYGYMFKGCSSLTTAPELPAITLESSCYTNMFNGCTSLNKITMLATDISAYSCLYRWVSGISSSGTFTKNPLMVSLPNGNSGIPFGWTVKNCELTTPCIVNLTSSDVVFYYSDGMFTPSSSIIQLYPYYSEENLLSFQPQCDMYVDIIKNDGSIITANYLWETTKTLGDVINENTSESVLNIGINILEIIIPENEGGYYYYNIEEKEPFVEKDWFRIVSLSDNNTISLIKDIDYSINGETWEKLSANNQLTVNNNDIVYFKGTELKQQFNVSNKFNVEGNIMSLIYNNDFEGQTDLRGKDYAFYQLFYHCTQLIDASNLILPATTLAYTCYSSMFDGCTSLTTAPELPAITLADDCYEYMFYKCTSLTTAPELPATTLASSCYQYMFYECTSLTTATELPATTLAYSCYGYMFQGCTSLTTAPELLATTLASRCYSNMFSDCSNLVTAPELPATTLAYSCYESMFDGCTSLTTAPELPAITLADDCYEYMFYKCTSLTTAPELPATTLADYCYSGMFNGCRSLTTAPELPATTLSNYCYYYMFNGCSKLNNITMLATDISASSCLFDWVSGVGESGTFIKHPSMTTLPSGTHGIPSGWTVVDYES